MDEADFDDFFRAMYPRARALAFRLLGSRTAAEDAASEAFVRCLVRWRRVGGLEHRSAWVMRVTTNVAVDVLRRRPPSAVLPSLADSPGAELDDAIATRLALRRELVALPKRQREAVVLRYFADLSERDVAAAMRVSTNSARTHLRRGLAQLRAARPALTVEGAE